MHYLKIKMKGKLVEIIDLQILVHSNEMVCRKRGRIGLDPVQHQVIAGGGRITTLANDAYIMAPYRVSLPETLAMSRSTHIRLGVFIETLMGRDHPASHGLDAFSKSIIEQETELEYYSLRYQGVKTKLPDLLT